MKQESKARRMVHVLLRPGFGAALLAAQFLSRRQSLFSKSGYLVALGALLIATSVWLWLAASVHCSRASRPGEVATSGPYAIIRHPIYSSVLLLGAGLGLLFFSWLHLLVVVASIPLWWLEGKSEEEDMTRAFGSTYADYQRRTAMLIPGIL